MASSGSPHPAPHAELIDCVRHWVHFDNLAETLTKQVNNARTMRSTYEEKTLKLLEVSNLKNAVLQITGGTLQRQTRYKPTDLSWGFVEEQLQQYYKSKGKSDESAAILEFLQTHRGGKSVEYLKKTSADPSPKKTPGP